MKPLADQNAPLTISELTGVMKEILEMTFSDVWVVGEVSNCSQPKSGHCYLTLKDDQAQLSAVIWRSTLSKVRFQLKNGLEILCRGRLEIYPPHGKYQLIITSVEPKGMGTLELAFRQLHEKLSAEGLFLPQRKKMIPKTIRRIAVVTSPTGAAIRDFLNVLGRRTKRVDVILVPVKVQGEGASLEIAQAIQRVNECWTKERPDVIAVIRGGGSVEDLWAFNEEKAVRALAQSKIPTTTGIGHEIDVSLCDLAADLHALTPSDAAARLVMEDAELERWVNELASRLNDGIDRKFRLLHDRLRQWETSIALTLPERRIVEPRQKNLDYLEQRLNLQMDRFFEGKKALWAKMAAQLESLSPLSVLDRGYSLTQRDDGTLVTSAETLQGGDTLRTRLRKGTVVSVVSRIETASEPETPPRK